MEITTDLLRVNRWSRPGRPLSAVLAIVFHWVGNPGTSAKENRDYFESRGVVRSEYCSAHYIIGLEGEVLQCIPEGEVAYHVGSEIPDPASGRIYTDWARWKFGSFAGNPETTSPNNCTIGIELCHTDRAGHHPQATLESALELARDLCGRYELDPMSSITTHWRVVGYKRCPRMWTARPELFERFRREVKARMGSGDEIDRLPERRM